MFSFFFPCLFAGYPCRRRWYRVNTLLAVLSGVQAAHCHYTSSVLAVYWQCSNGTSNTTAVPMCVDVFFVGLFLFSLFLLQIVFVPETLAAGVNIVSDTGSTGRGNRSILEVYWQFPGGVTAVL